MCVCVLCMKANRLVSTYLVLIGAATSTYMFYSNMCVTLYEYYDACIGIHVRPCCFPIHNLVAVECPFLPCPRLGHHEFTLFESAKMKWLRHRMIALGVIAVPNWMFAEAPASTFHSSWASHSVSTQILIQCCDIANGAVPSQLDLTSTLMQPTPLAPNTRIRRAWSTRKK